MVKDIYEKWLNHPNLDPSYKEVLEQMDEGQINDAFYTTIEFGTAGMRGLLGPGTNRINLHTIRKANVGFAEYICANGEDAMKRGVAIGYDNRHMSKESLWIPLRCLRPTTLHPMCLKVFARHRS